MNLDFLEENIMAIDKGEEKSYPKLWIMLFDGASNELARARNWFDTNFPIQEVVPPNTQIVL